MKRLLVLCLCLLATAGCSPDSVEIATWRLDWARRDIAYPAIFELKDRCIAVQVEGADHLAALPEGTKADTSGITWLDGQKTSFGEETTVGGSSFTMEEAHTEIAVDIPERCIGLAPRVWAVP